MNYRNFRIFTPSEIRRRAASLGVPEAIYARAVRLPGVFATRSSKSLSRFPWLDTETLFGAAWEGFASAERDWDRRPGVKFSSFAYTRTSAAVLEEVRRQSPVSRRQAKLIQQAVREGGLDRLPGYLCPTLSIEATIAGTDEEGDPLYLRGALRADDDPEAGTVQRLEDEVLWAFVDALPETERYVVQRYYGDEITLREIAFEIGRSESRVHQLRDQAHEHLRQMANPPPPVRDEWMLLPEAQEHLGYTFERLRAYAETGAVKMELRRAVRGTGPCWCVFRADAEDLQRRREAVREMISP
jgi:RNA polymerase sigma factor for flagellar operon FliA